MNTLQQQQHHHNTHAGPILQIIAGWTILYAGAIILAVKAFHSLI
ncbi:hypothetical protein [Acinetobacter soli]|nr:hypothetical protein [Acinetobacter soli]